MATIKFAQDEQGTPPSPEWQAKIDQFAERINSQSKYVKVVPREALSAVFEQGSTNRVTFDVRMIVPDDEPFLDKQGYDEGHAYVHTSKAFEEAIKSVGTEIFGKEPNYPGSWPNWNNTGSVFWFTEYTWNKK